MLVVGNNSTDRMREVVEDFCHRFPGRFRCLSEPQPGRSFVLNSRGREAWGDAPAFVDHDVTVDPRWLHDLTHALGGGEWVRAGKRIVLQWPPSLPLGCPSRGHTRAIPCLASTRLAKPFSLLGHPAEPIWLFERGYLKSTGSFTRIWPPAPTARFPVPARTPNSVTGYWRRAKGCVTNHRELSVEVRRR